jgi:hypothetical protein
MDNAIICDRDLALEILLNKYEPNKVTRLYGYLVQRQTLSKEQMLARGYKERTLQDWDKAIHDAGIALTMTDKVALPPLSIDFGAKVSMEQRLSSDENVDSEMEEDTMEECATEKGELADNAQKIAEGFK